VLLLAPHPDDETLCCAGLIQQAVAAGAMVHVVWVTPGDGFELDSALMSRRLDPGVEEWPYLELLPGQGHTVLNSDRYFDLALRARERHGPSFGPLLQRAIGLTLTVKVVTTQGPAFLSTGVWAPRQDRPEYFQVTS